MISFDAEGVCSICRQIEYKQTKIDWAAKEKEFLALLEPYRGRGAYDCIVPFSGGKDSTFTLWALVKKYCMKPLVVSFDHGFYRPNVLRNTERTIKKLGVDYLKFKSNWQVVKKLMRESLIRKGDIMWHSHCGIFAFPMQIAIKFNIPLVIWGEPSSEYISYYNYGDNEAVDEKRFNRMVNLGINAEDMVGMLDGTVTAKDLEPYTFPAAKDLKNLGYRSICLGSYIPWDTKKQAELIRKELGWRGDRVEGIPFDRYWYEKIEDAFQGIQDYLKYLKRGWSRMTHLASIDIRNGRMTRDEAFRLIKEYEGRRPASLDVFLRMMNISEEEFHAIALRHVVSPHRPDMSDVRRGAELPDQKMWTINNDLDA